MYGEEEIKDKGGRKGKRGREEKKEMKGGKEKGRDEKSRVKFLR